jgi:hypothetical protein
MQKNVQCVANAEGHKTAVILPIEEYEEMMKDLEMGRATRESEARPRQPFEDVVKEYAQPAKLTFSASIASRSECELKRLDQPVKNRIVSAISALASDPRPPGCLKARLCALDWSRPNEFRLGLATTSD